MAQWRAMRVDDLGTAEALGSDFHIHHPEGADIAPERLLLAPDWCFVLDSEAGFAGYAVAHPWGGALPPGLNTRLRRLPDPADSLHVHDVVLTAAARGQGHAGRLVAMLLGLAAAAGLRRLTLIAVGNAGPYWARQGFSDDPDPLRRDFVTRSYGTDATPMVRPVPPIAKA